MNDSIRQFAVWAQGSGMEDWIDILFIAVMALLWLVGGLVKAMGRKGSARQKQPEGLAREQRRPRETWQQRLMRKAEELQRMAEAKGRQATERARVRERTEQGPRRRPQPPGGRITVRADERGQSIMVYERPTPEPSTERAQHAARQKEARAAVVAAGRQATAPAPEIDLKVETGRPTFEPILEGLTDVMREPPKPVELGVQRPETARESVGFPAASVIDYRDPDALKKAILHYEILGKPVALRDLSERTPI